MGRHHYGTRPLDFDGVRRTAEFERELIRARTGEGRARAVANVVKMGRKPTLTPHQRREAIKRVNAEKENVGGTAPPTAGGVL
jgi:DNA invertase Pin-like site-specific DNA recombinase